MTNLDRPRLARVLAILGETFGESVSDIRAEGYFAGLQDLSIDEVEFAARESLRLSKFFPRPAELRELAIGTQDSSAELAWLDLRTEVKRVGMYGRPRLPTHLMAAIESTWGSWRELCATLPNDGPELLGWAKRFKTTYGLMTNRQRIEDGLEKLAQPPDRFLIDD